MVSYSGVEALAKGIEIRFRAGAALRDKYDIVRTASNVAFLPLTGSTLTINTATNITATSSTKSITEMPPVLLAAAVKVIARFSHRRSR